MNRDEIINICENVAQFETVGDESKAVFEATILIKSLELELDKYKAEAIEMARTFVNNIGDFCGCPVELRYNQRCIVHHEKGCPKIKAEQLLEGVVIEGQELDKYKAGVVNVSKLELKLKKALDNFVYIHSWDDACNTSAFYTGFHLINKIIELLKGE